MQNERALARAYGDCPREAVVWEVRGNLVYLSNPRSIDRVERGETSPVGYPCEDVFVFDEELYGNLARAYRENRNDLSGLWELVISLSLDSLRVPRG